MKIISVTAPNDISAIDHRSSDTEKYKILEETQSIPENFQLPKQQFGTRRDGKPHFGSFSKSCLEEFKSDDLVYSIDEDAASCKFC